MIFKGPAPLIFFVLTIFILSDEHILSSYHLKYSFYTVDSFPHPWWIQM